MGGQAATELLADEQLALWEWRYNAACDAGLAFVEAQEFAESHVDIGELRRLQTAGCPPHLIARLLL
jgi:hypothetical protein